MEWIIGIGSSVIASVLILLTARATGFVTITAARRSQQRHLSTRMLEAGLTNLFTTRADYAEHRGISTLMGYLATARRSVLVVGYWMAQGNEIEDMNDLGKLIMARPDFRVRIAVIHPKGLHIESLAEHLGEDPQTIRNRCLSTLTKLERVRNRLPIEARQRLQVRTYSSTAVASIIVLDDDMPEARVQVDIKPYRTARNNSVGFEASGPGRVLYDVWRRAAVLRFEDAREWPP